MKNIFSRMPVILLAAILFSCGTAQNTETQTTADSPSPTTGQSDVKDDVSMKDVVKVAVASPDHTTLVAAVKQADLVNVLSNAGPFTVFAPTNAAFDKLPAGTVDDLMKDENRETLQDILQYHVTTSSFSPEMLRDGQVLGMVNGGNVTVSVKDGKIMLNNSANVVASIRASNGMVHVIDGVLTPAPK
jgi:uncharacterized surface protein with fasciclin (FAS1) repeats